MKKIIHSEKTESFVANITKRLDDMGEELEQKMGQIFNDCIDKLDYYSAWFDYMIRYKTQPVEGYRMLNYQEFAHYVDYGLAQAQEELEGKEANWDIPKPDKSIYVSLSFEDMMGKVREMKYFGKDTIINTINSIIPENHETNRI